MAGRRPHLDLSPESCDSCGACVDVCEPGAITLGAGFIYVDWSACGDCVACVQACERGAIEVKSTGRVARPVVDGAVTTIPSAAPSTTEAFPVAAASATSPWTLPEAAVALVAAMVLLLASNVTLAGGWAGSLTASSLVALRAALQVVYYGGLLASIVWFARRKGVPFMRSVGLVRFGWVGSAAWVVAAFALLVVAYVMYGFLAQTLGWEPVGGGVTDLTGWFGTDVVGLAFAIGTVVLLTPFVEEVVFRGVVLGALRRHVSAPVAVVASALVFAVSHTTPWMMVPHTLLGVALGWMTVARGSVWPAVALHTLYNGAVVAAVYSIGGRGV